MVSRIVGHMAHYWPRPPLIQLRHQPNIISVGKVAPVTLAKIANDDDLDITRLGSGRRIRIFIPGTGNHIASWLLRPTGMHLMTRVPVSLPISRLRSMRRRNA